MTTDIRERVAEVLAGMPLHELTKPERDYFLRAAAFLLEAFPQLAEPVEYEFAVQDSSGEIATRWFRSRRTAEEFAYESTGSIVRRRRAGEWEVVE